jgi:hypothetical protein
MLAKLFEEFVEELDLLLVVLFQMFQFFSIDVLLFLIVFRVGFLHLMPEVKLYIEIWPLGGGGGRRPNANFNLGEGNIEEGKKGGNLKREGK